MSPRKASISSIEPATPMAVVPTRSNKEATTTSLRAPCLSGTASASSSRRRMPDGNPSRSTVKCFWRHSSLTLVRKVRILLSQPVRFPVSKATREDPPALCNSLSSSPAGAIPPFRRHAPDRRINRLPSACRSNETWFNSAILLSLKKAPTAPRLYVYFTHLFMSAKDPACKCHEFGIHGCHLITAAFTAHVSAGYRTLTAHLRWRRSIPRSPTPRTSCTPPQGSPDRRKCRSDRRPATRRS